MSVTERITVAKDIAATTGSEENVFKEKSRTPEEEGRWVGRQREERGLLP